MARQEKNTVTYFPHIISDGKKMFFIEKKYGNDGYATWFKLLEKLGSTDYHYLNLNDDDEVMYLAAKCSVTEETLLSIINDLVKLGVFDKELWESKVIWCQYFIDNIQDAYKKRNNKCILLDDLRTLLQSKGILLPTKGSLKVSGNTHIKVKNSKEDKTKEKKRERETEKTVSTHTPEFILKYQNFNTWLEKNATQVLKLQKPISIDEYKSICKKIEDKEFSHDVAMDVLKSMGNKKDLLKKYISGYLTLLNWIALRKKTEKDNPVSNQYNQGKKYRPASKQSQAKVIPPEERWSAVTSGIEKLYLNGQRFNDIGSSFFNHFLNIGVIDLSGDQLAEEYAWKHFVADPDIPQNEKELRKQSELKKLKEEFYLKQVVKSVPKEELLAKLQPVIFG